MNIERTFSGNKSLEGIIQDLIDIIEIPTYNKPKANIAPPDESDKEGSITNE